MNQKPRLIVFDLDGTLIDTMGSFADTAGQLIREHYGWTFEAGRKGYLETSGIPFFQQLEVLFPRDERNGRVAELFEKMKIENFLAERVSTKTLETLHALRDLEIRTAISSNNFHDLVKEFVHRENVPVDLALGFKPDFAKGIQHFDHLRRYFNIPFKEMVFVGDSLSDARKAKQVGIRFVAKLGTFTEADFRQNVNTVFFPVIWEIYELLDLLEELWTL
ncbi:MAG: HAD family hydrolase [Calditrichaeota bacterium]|nr:MAG: HAD family hydrolase [Calditrichota bacterium]